MYQNLAQKISQNKFDDYRRQASRKTERLLLQLRSRQPISNLTNQNFNDMLTIVHN